MVLNIFLFYVVAAIACVQSFCVASLWNWLQPKSAVERLGDVYYDRELELVQQGMEKSGLTKAEIRFRINLIKAGRSCTRVSLHCPRAAGVVGTRDSEIPDWMIERSEEIARESGICLDNFNIGVFSEDDQKKRPNVPAVCIAPSRMPFEKGKFCFALYTIKLNPLFFSRWTDDILDFDCMIRHEFTHALGFQGLTQSIAFPQKNLDPSVQAVREEVKLYQEKMAAALPCLVSRQVAQETFEFNYLRCKALNGKEWQHKTHLSPCFSADDAQEFLDAYDVDEARAAHN